MEKLNQYRQIVTDIRAILTIAVGFLCSGSLWAQSSPHGDNFTLSCILCHNTATWQVETEHITFNHESTGFELSGRHLKNSCRDCHKSLVFSKTGNQCIDCHGDVHEGELGLSCEACHTPSGWLDRRKFIDHHQETQFPLTGVHAVLDCDDCHPQKRYRFAVTPTQCADCHREAFLATRNPDHQAAGFSENCTDCHTPEHMGWRPNQYSHSPGFILTGGHAGLSCTDCHTEQYAGTSTSCEVCHMDDYNGTTDPDHSAFGFPTDCQTCHDTQSWDARAFDHAEQSGFVLEGAHSQIQCTDCHINNQLTGLARDCWSCHTEDYNDAADPDHAANNFSHECSDCHSQWQWQPATFDHNATAFALTGAHAALNCIECHTEGYVNTPADCWSCHQDDYNGAADPDHAANNFSHECADCHSSSAWIPSTFDHNATAFALTGAHAGLNCIECHTEGYAGTPADCWSCHADDYNGAADPDHSANNFSHECSQCHSDNAWTPATFDHSSTAFALTGAHAGLNCIDCHSAGYTGTSTDCFSCHADDYNGAADPDHAANNFSHNCSDCHSDIAWTPATFDHNSTAFALTGAHAALNCIECHTEGYAGTSTDCWSCHADDYNSAADPDHAANNFSHECSDCHSDNAWTPATFDHSSTAFALTGAHAALNCIECHTEGYAGTPADCWSCHADDYNGVTDPDHAANNFSHECSDCHGSDAWQPATFDHNNTAFILSGAHAVLNCIECHTAGYAGTPTDCWSCHADDYNSVTDPDHAGSNFSHECSQCHSSDAWQPATFDHNSTAFALTGAHAAVSCIECHSAGYSGTPTDCWSCHEDDYRNTSVIDHEAANFSRTCTQCHSTSAWRPASWDHDALYFPIYSGEHRGEWSDCSDCHYNSSSYSDFSCLGCHDHSQSKMDDKHSDVSGYQYNSAACYNCHPRGKE